MPFNIFLFIATVTVFAALAVMAVRFSGAESIGLGRFRFVLAKPMAVSGEEFTPRDGISALVWGLAALTITYAASVLYLGIFVGDVSWPAFCDAWRRYDAFHYLRLAEFGYGQYTEGGKPLFLVFFPLYPWLIRLLHTVIPSYALCGFIISGLCYLGSCYVFARLVTEEFGKKIGKLGLVFLTAYPFAFFFASLHTESLFLFLSLSSFYFIRKHKYPLAGLFGALAALSRMQGVFLAVIAFIEYCMTERPIRKFKDRNWRGLWGDLWGKLFWMAFMGAGTLSYLLLNYSVTGDPFRFLVYQKERWYQGYVPFYESLSRMWRAIWNPSEGYGFAVFTTWLPELVLFVFCLIMLVYGARRLPPVWTAYYAVCLLLNYSLANPLSCCRYIACAFPLPVMLAMGSQKRPQLGRFVLVIYGVLLGVFLFAYLAGRHVC